MAKFLGVITNSTLSPSNDRVLEFTDLELLADFLLNETQNLLYEFLLKAQFSNERELVIYEHYNQFTEIHNFFQFLVAKTLEIERDTDKVGEWLCKMEKSINRMENYPLDYGYCRCTNNMERTRTLDMLVQLSSDICRIEEQLEQVKEEETVMPEKDPCSLSEKLLPFLELHLTILEQIEEKICRLSDLLKRVGEMFINVHKRIIGACYHKPQNPYASDC